MRTRGDVLSNAEFEHVLSTVRTDMRKLEILTKNRVRFLALTFDSDYEWPIARVTVDEEEEMIWYDFTTSHDTYWCEDMGVSGSLLELAKSLK